MSNANVPSGKNRSASYSYPFEVRPEAVCCQGGGIGGMDRTTSALSTVDNIILALCCTMFFFFSQGRWRQRMYNLLSYTEIK